MRKPAAVSEWIALIVVTVISVSHPVLTHGFVWMPSFVVTAIGLLFIAAFLFNKKAYTTLFLTWALCQLPVIQSDGRDVFNFSQGLYFSIGLNLQNGVHLGISLVPLLHTALAIRLKMDSIFGTRVRLLPFEHDVMLSHFLPAEVELVRRMKLGEETSWYLVKFIETDPAVYALIRGRDSYIIRGGEKQVVEFLKVEDPEWTVKSGKLERKLLRNHGWAVVE